MKTLTKILRQDRERLAVPKNVQDVIPVEAVWDDGIFMAGTKYSKTFRFGDINYAVASKEDKEAMFLEYSELLNSFDSGATYKITVIVKKLDEEEFKKSILIPMKGDKLDRYRAEYNKILLGETAGASGYVRQRYITVSAHKKSIGEARSYFSRAEAELTAHFNRLGSRAAPLDGRTKLRIFYDFFCGGVDIRCRFNKQPPQYTFKDMICPEAFEFKKDHFRAGEKYGRAVFLKDYASYIKDEMLSELCDVNRSSYGSIGNIRLYFMCGLLWIFLRRSSKSRLGV